MRLASLAFVLLIAGCNGCSKPQSGDPLPTGTSKPTATTASAAPSSSAPKSPGGDTSVNLTHARSATPTTKGLPMIAVTGKEIRFVGTKNDPLPMPPPVSWYAGMPLSMKGDKPGMTILPIAKWLKDARKGDERDLSVVVENAISYRIAGEVFLTAALSGFDRFHVVVLTPDESYGEMIIEMPRLKLDAGVAPPFASILVLQEGILIKTEMSNVGPGCAGFGVGLTFPRVNGQVDTIGLPSCMDRITPDGGGSPDIVVGGLPEIPFAEVVSVIDGVRARKAKTVVHLGLQRIPQNVPTIPGLSDLPPMPAPKPSK